MIGRHYQVLSRSKVFLRVGSAAWVPRLACSVHATPAAGRGQQPLPPLAEIPANGPKSLQVKMQWKLPDDQSRVLPVFEWFFEWLAATAIFPQPTTST
jgi:hypothetical protein